ncbi:MAG TPA: hypothetical protein DCS60_08035 [Opitutae bacterium]|nr:hypothetical protein [Opitutae bacterium]
MENFLYTRFHDEKLRFANTGIKGDLLDRFDEDLAKWQLQYVSLLLGMNDRRYQEFEWENFAVYQRDVNTVLDRLNEIEARLIILLLTLFDQWHYTIRNKDPDFCFERLSVYQDYNTKLAFYEGWLWNVPWTRYLEYLDLLRSMNDFTTSFRQNRSFTMIPDSINPNPDGMALMAVEMARYFAESGVEASRMN